MKSLRGGGHFKSEIIEEIYQALDGVINLCDLFPDTLRVLLNHSEATLSWLFSQEFEEKWRNQPYPPLVNPSNIDYMQMPAELAWELNLPLPPFFDFILLKSHGSGGTGLNSFLQKCGCIYFNEEGIVDARVNYISLYHQIMEAYKKKERKYLFLQNFVLRGDFQKFCSLIPEKKALFLVRDPISVLKHFLTYNRKRWQSIIFNLTHNPKDVLENCFGYGMMSQGAEKAPNLGEIPFWMNYFPLCFHDAQLLEACRNIKEVHYLDMQEIVGEKTFDTMRKLAEIYGFSPPHDKSLFVHNVTKFRFVENLYLLAHPSDLEKLGHGLMNDRSFLGLESGIPLLITNCYNLHKDKVDITKVFFKEDIAPLVIQVEARYCQALNENREFTCVISKYLHCFVSAIFQKAEEEKKKAITEKDVLEYFKRQKVFKERFKEVLRAHLKHIKECRSDIVESWKYYAEFEEMCKT